MQIELYKRAYRQRFHQGKSGPNGVAVFGSMHLSYSKPEEFADLLIEMKDMTPGAEFTFVSAFPSNHSRYTAVVLFSDEVQSLPARVNVS